ncbi:hypothetical protein ABH935_002885 [Catenulispora sp. GAS73]|uniref:hypothetical protein n=1 Tax=Catenulispora sp. GAS73 TaxID=3156269 RepID=UPI003519B9EA
MRVLMATASALLVAMAVATGTGAPALAEDKPANPTVQPNPASPGTQVWVYDANECTAPSGTATSQALAAPIALAPLANMTGGGGTLRQGLAAGTYTITLHCGSTLTATLHVNTHSTTTHTTATPTGAAATGDGSAEDHLGIGDAAVGSAFLLGGLGFATASFIRRRRATPHG